MAFRGKLWKTSGGYQIPGNSAGALFRMVSLRDPKSKVVGGLPRSVIKRSRLEPPRWCLSLTVHLVQPFHFNCQVFWEWATMDPTSLPSPQLSFPNPLWGFRMAKGPCLNSSKEVPLEVVPWDIEEKPFICSMWLRQASLGAVDVWVCVCTPPEV